MNRRKQFAMNKLFNFCVVLGLLFAWGTIDLFLDAVIAWGIGFCLVALLFIVLPAIFTPYCYAFDRDGVSLHYVFLPVERYLWKDIYAIEVEDKIRSTRVSLLDFFYNSIFSIYGSNVGETRFYMNGHIRKSFRTKYLLEKYWDGTITGYLFEDVTKWVAKRNAKKQSYIKSHLTDEVVPMEREVRAEMRERLRPFIAQVKQYDLEVTAKYMYVTKDSEELNSRPKEDYTYTLVAEIAHFNETDENRVAVLRVDLLYVRLGKTSYRGVKNELVKEALEFAISDALEDINKNEMDVYRKTL